MMDDISRLRKLNDDYFALRKNESNIISQKRSFLDKYLIIIAVVCIFFSIAIIDSIDFINELIKYGDNGILTLPLLYLVGRFVFFTGILIGLIIFRNKKIKNEPLKYDINRNYNELDKLLQINSQIHTSINSNNVVDYRYKSEYVVKTLLNYIDTYKVTLPKALFIYDERVRKAEEEKRRREDERKQQEAMDELIRQMKRQVDEANKLNEEVNKFHRDYNRNHRR